MKLKGSIAGATLSFLCLSSLLYAEQVRIPEGTRVQVRLQADLLSSQVDEASRVDFVVARPVMIRGLVVIPAGAVAWGAVQSVKKDKWVKFDIEGVRLPDLTRVTLRTKPDKSDVIKVDSQLEDTAGAPEGTEFTAYVDKDVTVEASTAPAPASTPAVNPTPVPVQVAPPAVLTPVTPTPGPAAQSAPTTPAPAPRPAPTPAAPVVATGELITVECFSDPSDADILIDGDFYGTTPSILKLPPGTHQLEFRLEGYKTYSEPLNLHSGAPLSTIRRPLEKKQ